MSEQAKIVVVTQFRCGGKVVKPKKQLTVGEDVSKSEARSLVSQGKAKWLEAKSDSKSGGKYTGSEDE